MIKGGEPRSSTSYFLQLLSSELVSVQVQCCFTDVYRDHKETGNSALNGFNPNQPNCALADARCYN